MVEFHSKYISNQKYCCNPLNRERHGSAKKGNFLFLLEYSFSKLNYKQLLESNVLKICSFMARFIYNIHYIKYISEASASMRNKCFEYFNQILERYYEEVHFLVNLLADNLQ